MAQAAAEKHAHEHQWKNTFNSLDHLRADASQLASMRPSYIVNQVLHDSMRGGSGATAQPPSLLDEFSPSEMAGVTADFNPGHRVSPQAGHMQGTVLNSDLADSGVTPVLPHGEHRFSHPMPSSSPRAATTAGVSMGPHRIESGSSLLADLLTSQSHHHHHHHHQHNQHNQQLPCRGVRSNGMDPLR